MESCTQIYARKIVDSIIHGLDQKHSSILFVKHYNNLNISMDSIQEAVDKSNVDVEFLYHEFSSMRMQEAYEPFLSWIKQLYFKYYYRVPLDDFLEKTDVYYLSRSTIKSYIMQGECDRAEDIIVVEVEYERKQFINSLINILTFISKEHTLFVVLNKLHLAEEGTLNFLYHFVERNYDNISLLANYNEAYEMPSYTSKIWSELVHKIEELNYMLDWNIQDLQAEVNIMESFEPKLSDFSNYLIKINNMILTLSTKQASYYLDVIYNRLITERISINPKNLVRFYILYATAAIYEGNYTTALSMCDRLKNMNNRRPNVKYTFKYYYLLTVCEIYGGQPSLARKNSEKCRKIAQKSGSEKCLLYAQILDYMCILDGWMSYTLWHGIIDETESIDSFKEKCIKHKLYNHLAHIMFYVCGNKKSYFSGDAEKCENQQNFVEAMNLAKMLKNERLMISAWKRNVFLAQGYGYYSFVDYYYKKCLDIIGNQNDKAEEAAIYNGLGFNRIVSEQFNQANDYFNQSLVLYYKLKDAYSVAETLYNMAINAILSFNYDVAYNNLLQVLKLLNSIKQYRMRICNISKIYGMIVYCSYKTGIEYNAHFYLDKMERVLYHLLHCDGEPNYYLWDDDMFFYYFCSALLEKSDNIEKAQEYMDKAKIHMYRSEGLQFFVYEMFAEEQYDMYVEQGEIEKGEEILNACIEFCNKNGYKNKEERLFAKLHKKGYIEKHIPIHVQKIDKSQIDELTQISEMKVMLADRTKGINFLLSWQELLNKANMTVESIIDDSMVMLQNNYNVDYIMYVDVVDGVPIVKYNSSGVNITDDQLAEVAAYLRKHKKEFVSSRLDRGFYEYTPILNIYGINNIISFACVPVTTNDELSGFMIACIELHENMSSSITTFDRNDLTIFKFAVRQMNDTIYRLKARDEINAMNDKLQKSAVTDLLTGLYNRQGFTKNLDDYRNMVISGKKEDTEAAVIYLDLDNFKYYNDTFGHDIGDEVLIAFSRLFEKVVGTKGYIVRYGGDEFVIVLPGYDVNTGEQIAKDIYKGIEDSNHFAWIVNNAADKNAEIAEKNKVSCSMGIAGMDIYDTAHMNDALKRADNMLYTIKKNGKSNYMVWTEEHEKNSAFPED